MIAQRLPIVRPMEIDIIWETGEELLVKSESDSDSDDEHVKENDRKTSKNRPLLREELLVPRTRRIGTWLEGATASLRLEKRLPPTKSS